jgi:arginase family enzyme
MRCVGLQTTATTRLECRGAISTYAQQEKRERSTESPVYISIDLDVLDPAYAPAVADPEVGGLTSRELFSLLNKFKGLNIVGADIACFCPPFDNPGQITALTASEILLQYVALIADYRTRVVVPTAGHAAAV